MANEKLREDKTCQNCGRYVAKKFCPNCGQKNTVSRRSFYGLVVEFLTKFTNYDNSFWLTLRYLFTSPAKLSKEYMAGKRKTYLNPVQLFLFCSFLAFFIPMLIPNINHSEEEFILKQEDDDDKFSDQTFDKYGFVESRSKLDSIHFSLPPEERISELEYAVARFLIRANSKMYTVDRTDIITNFMIDNASKAIFCYMPIFAFLLWLVHGKRRFYYFDSGVFTLHFFSMVMLVVSSIIIMHFVLEELLDWTGWFALYFFLALGYITFYFFRAHRRFYGEKRYISRLKCLLLFTVNTILILFVITIYAVLAFVI